MLSYLACFFPHAVLDMMISLLSSDTSTRIPLHLCASVPSDSKLKRASGLVQSGVAMRDTLSAGLHPPVAGMMHCPIECLIAVALPIG